MSFSYYLDAKEKAWEEGIPVDVCGHIYPHLKPQYCLGERVCWVEGPARASLSAQPELPLLESDRPSQGVLHVGTAEPLPGRLPGWLGTGPRSKRVSGAG